MVGVITNDDELFRIGVNDYIQGINELSDDGSFAIEMTRHELALHYQNFAIDPLVMIAEVASRQGLDLYAYKAKGRDLHSAINFLASAVKDSTVVAKYASEKQNMKTFTPGDEELAWTEFYQARFKKDPLGLLDKPIFYPRNGGAITLLTYTPK